MTMLTRLKCCGLILAVYMANSTALATTGCTDITKAQLDAVNENGFWKKYIGGTELQLEITGDDKGCITYRSWDAIQQFVAKKVALKVNLSTEDVTAMNANIKTLLDYYSGPTRQLQGKPTTPGSVYVITKSWRKVAKQILSKGVDKTMPRMTPAMLQKSKTEDFWNVYAETNADQVQFEVANGRVTQKSFGEVMSVVKKALTNPNATNNYNSQFFARFPNPSTGLLKRWKAVESQRKTLATKLKSVNNPSIEEVFECELCNQKLWGCDENVPFSELMDCLSNALQMCNLCHVCSSISGCEDCVFGSWCADNCCGVVDF